MLRRACSKIYKALVNFVRGKFLQLYMHNGRKSMGFLIAECLIPNLSPSSVLDNQNLALVFVETIDGNDSEFVWLWR